MEDKFSKTHILNSKKHTIEFVDSDGIENLKMVHYAGGYKEFTNFANIEFAPENDQKLVIGDQFETTNSDKHEFVGMDKKTKIDGDEYEDVGNSDFETALNIKTILEDIHQYAQLFDVRRVRQYDEDVLIQAGGRSQIADSLPNFVSPLQTKERADDPIFDVNDIGHRVCPKCGNGDPKSNFDFNEDQITPTSLVFSPAMLANCGLTYPALAAGQNLQTIVIPFTSPLDLELLAKLAGKNGQSGFYKGAKCDVCNSDLLFTPDKDPGYSPSSHNGDFKEEERKKPGGDMERLIIDYTPTLVNLEKKLSGGDKIITINKNKIEKIGTIVNDLPSIRVDPIGKMRTESVFVSPGEVYVSVRPSPHIEPVDVLNVPGGDYILTASNKFKLLVGAKGINMKTFGPIEMYGTLVNITAQQLNISSQYETNIDGGDRVNFRARKISFNPREHSPVVVEGAFHVARNMIVRGGGYIDGQFGTPAIASVREIQQTSDAIWLPGDGTSYVACGKGIVDPNTSEVEVAVVIPAHRHLYERPASQLFNSIELLRAYMSDPDREGADLGADGTSINDVVSLVAATPTNNTSLGRGTEIANVYAERQNIRQGIVNFMGINGNIRPQDVGQLNVLSVNVRGDQVTGSFSIRVQDEERGTGEFTGPRRGNRRIGSEILEGEDLRMSFRINFDIQINTETDEFVRENTPLSSTLISGDLPVWINNRISDIPPISLESSS